MDKIVRSKIVDSIMVGILSFAAGFAVCGMGVGHYYTAKTPTIKHEINFTSPNPKGNVFVSDTLGECDLSGIGTKTTKITDVCEIAPIPVSATVFVVTKEYKLLGLTVWKSKKIEIDRE